MESIIYGLGVAALAYLAFIAAVTVIAVPLIVLVLRCQRKPSRATLPNGMKVTQWTDFETKFLYNEIFGDDNAYERGGIVFREGATVIDCGANIGMFTLWAAKKCRGNARILSFEPIPSTFGVLQANVQDAVNGAFDESFSPRDGASLDISAFNFGVSDEEVPNITFEHHPNLSIWSTSDEGLATGRVSRIVDDVDAAVAAAGGIISLLFPSFLRRFLLRVLFTQHFAATEKVDASLQPLEGVIDAYAPTGPIDVLKVDVEGAEVMVLRGIGAHQWPRIQQVVMEVEDFKAVRTVSKKWRKKAATYIHTHTCRMSMEGMEGDR
jgi:hypothetical protein